MTPWIRSTDELARLTTALAGCRALAIDTESDGLHHHVEKVCLIQIASDRGEAWLVDPLAVGDLGPLAPLLADAGVVKVLHGADYDVGTLKRDFGFTFKGIFDTMIAARFLGRAEIGLQSLVGSELGVTLSKSNQKDDWSRRPLSPKQESYALADVQHLLALRERLSALLHEKGRLEWAQEECEALSELEPVRRRRDPDAYQKIKGAGRLAPRQLAVLREVYAFREARAETTDIPAFKIVGNDVLLAMALDPPRTREEVARHVDRFPRVRSHASALLEAVARALALAEADLPQIARPVQRFLPHAVRLRIEALKAWRSAEAARSGLDVSVVLPQRLIDRLADAAPRALAELHAIEGLRRWRIEAYGAALLAAS